MSPTVPATTSHPVPSGVKAPSSAGAAPSAAPCAPAYTLDDILDALPAGVDFTLSPELEAELRA
jgi:hypothetical protein